ncbi:hypothetical protein TcYC6_0030010 [Trypanosoma cruzi]|nr:hypothetical protein TcYC6_0030010 [Trypanosoma cruzi]
MEEEGVGGDEGESETPRHTTGQEDGGHPFSHDKTPALLDPVWCLAGGCHHSFSGPRRGEHLRSHILRSTVSRNGWTSPMKRSSRKDWFGVTRAGEVCSASLRARAAHRPRCGHYTCRKENIATQREEYRASVTGSHYTKTAACLERTPPVEWPTTPANRPAARPVAAGKSADETLPPQARVAQLAGCMPHSHAGIQRLGADERSRNRWPFMDLVRHHLRLPEKPSSRRHATRTNHNKQHNTEPPIDHFNNTTVGVVRAIGRPRTTRRARSAMRRQQQDPTAHQTERILTAARHIQGETRRDTVHTAGNGTRSRASSRRGGRSTVVFSPELVPSLDDPLPARGHAYVSRARRQCTPGHVRQQGRGQDD